MNPAMLNKLKKMQKEMMDAQQKLEEAIFTGSAGGGMVVCEVRGSKEVVSVKIAEDAIESKEDLEMLQDTIVAALNDAMKKIDTETNDTMRQFTGGFCGFGGF